MVLYGHQIYFGRSRPLGRIRLCKRHPNKIVHNIICSSDRFFLLCFWPPGRRVWTPLHPTPETKLCFVLNLIVWGSWAAKTTTPSPPRSLAV